MRFHAGFVAAGYLLLAGCPDRHPLAGNDGGEPGVAAAPEPMGFEAVASEAPALKAIAARLPADWVGTGVLTTRARVPPGAPAWAKIEAEVIEEDGKRYLRTSAEAQRINNPALARATAGNRARALLAQWLGTNRLVGSEITDVWGVPRQTTYARARIRVPVAWRPGMEVIPSPSGSAGSGVSSPLGTDSISPPARLEAISTPEAPAASTTEKL